MFIINKIDLENLELNLLGNDGKHYVYKLAVLKSLVLRRAILAECKALLFAGFLFIGKTYNYLKTDQK